MHPLVVYYLRQAGRGGSEGIGPVYSAPLYMQRGQGIGNFFGNLFRWVKPIIWSGAKAFGRETLRTGGKILSDIAENRSDEVNAKDIISRHVSDSTQNLINKLRGRGQKRRRVTKKRKPNEKAKIIKRDIFS